MGKKTITRVKVVGDKEEEINKTLKSLDEHYVVSVSPLPRGEVLITYAKKRAE